MRATSLLILLGALAGCGSSQDQTRVPPGSEAPSATTPATLTVTSADFVEGATLSLGQAYSGFGCVGSNRSPALDWTAVPGARSYAVSLFDPDAPGRGWWHWSVANIPASVTALPPGAGSRRGILPDGAVHGRTDFGNAGYGGPCPPVGDAPHRYVFTVYALNVDRLDVDSQTSGDDFKARVEAAAIAAGEITGRFGR